MEYLDCIIETKSDESGTFEGLLATYGNTDDTGDRIIPGAFNQTLAETGGRLPLLWGHDPRETIGTLTLRDEPHGLRARGKLVLTVTRAREVYSLLKDGAVRGLSIGFKTIKSRIVGDVRELLSVRLFEGSLTPTPANPLAVVTAVKQQCCSDADYSRFLAQFDRALSACSPAALGATSRPVSLADFRRTLLAEMRVD